MDISNAEFQDPHNKIIGRHELKQVYEGIKVERSSLILHQIAEGTLPKLVPNDEKKFNIEQTGNHQNDRLRRLSGSVESRLINQHQNLQLVMVWSPLDFVLSGVQINT